MQQKPSKCRLTLHLAACPPSVVVWITSCSVPNQPTGCSSKISQTELDFNSADSLHRSSYTRWIRWLRPKHEKVRSYKGQMSNQSGTERAQTAGLTFALPHKAFPSSGWQRCNWSFKRDDATAVLLGIWIELVAAGVAIHGVETPRADVSLSPAGRSSCDTFSSGVSD